MKIQRENPYKRILETLKEKTLKNYKIPKFSLSIEYNRLIIK